LIRKSDFLLLVMSITSNKKYRVGVGSFLKKIAVFFKKLPPKNDIFKIFGNSMFLLVGGGTSKFLSTSLCFDKEVDLKITRYVGNE